MNRLYDDTAQLITGARIVPERMIWQLLAPANGIPGITIKANGVNYTYNYDPDGGWKSTNFKDISGVAKRKLLCQTVDKSCSNCKWHDRFSWVCYNSLSECRADFTDPDDVCKEWEMRK